MHLRVAFQTVGRSREMSWPEIYSRETLHYTLTTGPLNTVCATLKVVFRVKNCIENRSKMSFKPHWTEPSLNARPFSVSIRVLSGSYIHRHLLTELKWQHSHIYFQPPWIIACHSLSLYLTQ